MPKVFDCFLFFNELDLLEIRLNVLSPVVDRFVLCEARQDHKGRPKPLHFQENRARFAPFLDRIIHIVADDLPPGGTSEADHFRRENRQRNELARGLVEADGEDFVIVSDLDEIPRPEIVRAIAGANPVLPTIHLFELRWYYYFLNYEKSRRWNLDGPRMTRKRHMISPQSLRRLRWPRRRFRLRRLLWTRNHYGRMVDLRRHADAGWHFSYMNGIEAVTEKLASYAHNHSAGERDPRHIARSIAEGRSYNTADTDSLTLRPIDASFPAYIRENQDRLRHLVADEARLAEIGRLAEGNGSGAERG